MAGYIGSRASVTVTSPETDSRYVNVTGDTMTGALLGTDLTLSGGVYLGGTGAANKLDDYEEGTWTPAFVGVTVTYNSLVTAGNYTKIGRLVHYSGVVSTNALDTTSANDVLITLPFSVSSGQANFAPVTLFVEEGFNLASAEAYQAITIQGNSHLIVYPLETPSSGNNYTNLRYSHLTDGADGTRVRFSGAYITDA